MAIDCESILVSYMRLLLLHFDSGWLPHVTFTRRVPSRRDHSVASCHALMAEVLDQALSFSTFLTTSTFVMSFSRSLMKSLNIMVAQPFDSPFL